MQYPEVGSGLDLTFLSQLIHGQPDEILHPFRIEGGVGLDPGSVSTRET